MAAGKLVFVDGLTALFSASSEGGVVEKGVGQGVKVLRSASGVDVEREVREVAEGLKGGEGAGRMARVVLVLDQPDVVLAATGTGTGTGMGTSTTSSGAGGAGGMGMDEVVASLRQVGLPFRLPSSVASPLGMASIFATIPPFHVPGPTYPVQLLTWRCD